MSKTPRQKKTPRQRAEEALAVAERKVKRLLVEQSKLRVALATVESDLAAETARRDYLKKHPDLGQQGPSTTPPGTTPTSTGDTA